MGVRLVEYRYVMLSLSAAGGQRRIMMLPSCSAACRNNNYFMHVGICLTFLLLSWDRMVVIRLAWTTPAHDSAPVVVIAC